MVFHGKKGATSRRSEGRRGGRSGGRRLLRRLLGGGPKRKSSIKKRKDKADKKESDREKTPLEKAKAIRKMLRQMIMLQNFNKYVNQSKNILLGNHI